MVTDSGNEMWQHTVTNLRQIWIKDGEFPGNDDNIISINRFNYIIIKHTASICLIGFRIYF